MSTTSARSERASEARFRSRHAARAATPCVLGEMRTSSIRTECCDVVDARRDDEREIRLRGERLDETDRVGADSALARLQVRRVDEKPERTTVAHRRT